MCSDPNHIKEFKEIAESMARMETKLDNVLGIVGDHEARLRVAETAIIVHNDNKPDHDGMKGQIAALEKEVASMKGLVDGFRKILWTVAAAAFGGLGLWIWRVIEKGL